MLHSSGPTVPKAQQLPQEPWSRTGVQPPRSRQSKEAGRPRFGVPASNGAPTHQSAGGTNPQSSLRGRSLTDVCPTVNVQPACSSPGVCPNAAWWPANATAATASRMAGSDGRGGLLRSERIMLGSCTYADFAGRATRTAPGSSRPEPCLASCSRRIVEFNGVRVIKDLRYACESRVPGISSQPAGAGRGSRPAATRQGPTPHADVRPVEGARIAT